MAVGDENHPAYVTWDHRQQPDWDVIRSCIRSYSLGRCDVALVETGSDEYALIIHDHKMTVEEAQRWWDTRHEWDPE